LRKAKFAEKFATVFGISKENSKPHEYNFATNTFSNLIGGLG